MKEIEELKENLYDATIKFLKEKESIIASDKQDKHALAEDRKRIEGEMKRISNVKSGFYKDLEEELGKQVNQDSANGKTSVVDIFGIKEAKKYIGKLQSEALEKLAKYGSRAAKLCELCKFLSDRSN